MPKGAALRRAAAVAWLIASSYGIGPFPTASAGQEASPGCDGAAAWLAATEQRFFMLIPVVPVAETPVDPVVIQAVFLGVQQEQTVSDPPPAAEGLNSQILAVIAQGAAAASRFYSEDDPAALDEGFGIVAQSTALVRAMARELKVRCNLTESGEFFDAACYGPEASAWYDRLSIRSLGVQRARDQAEAEVRRLLDAGAEVDGTEEHAALMAVLDGVAAASRAAYDEQAADAPPPALAVVQERELGVQRLLVDMLGWSATADEARWQRFEAELEEARAALGREKARLDIGCASTGSTLDPVDEDGGYVPGSYDLATYDPYADPALNGGVDLAAYDPYPDPALVGGAPPAGVTHEEIVAFCAAGPLYPEGTRMVLTRLTPIYREAVAAPALGGRSSSGWATAIVAAPGTELTVVGAYSEQGACDVWPVRYEQRKGRSGMGYVHEWDLLVGASILEAE